MTAVAGKATQFRTPQHFRPKGCLHMLIHKRFNEMGRNDADSVRQGSLARAEPDAQVMHMWEATEIYMDHGQPLIIVVERFERFKRIHRINLIGMGVLPLELEPGTIRLTLGLDGTKTFDVTDHRAQAPTSRSSCVAAAARSLKFRSLAASTPPRKSRSAKPVVFYSGLRGIFSKRANRCESNSKEMPAQTRSDE